MTMIMQVGMKIKATMNARKETEWERDLTRSPKKENLSWRMKIEKCVRS
jgi:hypothetical protein